MLDISSLYTTVQNPTSVSISYSISLSFLLSSLVAMTYQRTYQGGSYSRNYIQALILASIVGTIAMQAIGDNLARGLGMMGALAIVRFRSNLKDPKDMIFLFMSLAVGVSCGVYSFSIAATGAIGFCLFAFIIHSMPFSTETYYDGVLKFKMADNPENQTELNNAMAEYCESSNLIEIRETSEDEKFSYEYHVKFTPNTDIMDVLGKFKEINSLGSVRFISTDSNVEVKQQKSKKKKG